MKAFKRICFVCYALFTALVVGLSVIVFHMSESIQQQSYVYYFGNYYYIQNQAEQSMQIPKGALVAFKSSAMPYSVSDYVLCKNSDDTIFTGIVTDYTNDADFISYTVNVNGEELEVPKVYLLGRADSYSEFLGAVMRLNSTQVVRFMLTVLPCALMILLLGVLSIRAFINREHKVKNEFEEKDRYLFKNISKECMTGECSPRDDDIYIKHTKPYVNPNSHTELLKYDWLKEVAEKATRISQEEYDRMREAAKKEESGENQDIKKEEKEKIEEKPEIIPKTVVSFEEMEKAEKAERAQKAEKKEKTHGTKEILDDIEKILEDIKIDRK